MYKDIEAFENKSSKICYVADCSNREYNYNSLLKLCKGNIELTEYIFNMLDWKQPANILEHLLIERKVIYKNNKYILK